MVTRIGIIGDVHAEHERLAQALRFLEREGVDTVICTGDLADGTGCLDSCVALLKHHDVLTVRGNHDRWVLENKARHIPNAHFLEHLSDLTIAYLQDLPQERHVTTRHGELKLCHGVGSNDLQKIWPGTERMPAERSKRLDEIIDEGRFHLMVNGHVHYRTLIHFHNMTLLNAGTLRGDHRPGFALIDLETEQVHGFELEPEIHEVKTQSIKPNGGTRVFKNTQHFDDNWEPVTLYA